MSEIPFFRVSGDAHRRGLSLGSQLKDRIQETVNFYEQVVYRNSSLAYSEIQQRANHVKALLKQFNPNYCIEIEAMAESADLKAWRLYALNARTEILNAPVPECTSIAFRDSRIIGQTWDWIQEMEDLIVIVEHVYPDGNSLVTLTEPGMLAKIGMNDRGLGLCINILMSKHKLNGIPVHILSRSILESKNVNQARQIINKSGLGKSSHFLLGDRKGEFLSMEFSGGFREEIQLEKDTYIHTNHCLAKNIQSDPIPTSIERMNQGENWLRIIDKHSVSNMKMVLLDDRGIGPIQSCYSIEESLGGLKIGTCATVVMDLVSGEFNVKKGPDKNSKFTNYPK